MSFFDGIIGGAATSMAGDIGNQMQADTQLKSQQAMAQFNADLQEQKEKTLMALRQEMANAPLNRLGAKARDFAGQDVQVEAAPVTSLSGQDPKLADGTDGVSKGMVGNYADLVTKAKELPAEDQQPYLDQLKRQFGADTETARVGIIGQMRKRTPDEALNAAAEDAKVSDPVAYAAYQERIGNPDRANRRLDNQARKDDIREQKNDDDVADRRARANWQQTHQTEVLELQREIARQKAGGPDAKPPSEVASTQWLIANKDDPVAMAMWDKVHQSKTKGLEGIAADFMAKDSMLSAAEAVSKARELISASNAIKQAPDKPITQAEYAKLPSGAVFTAPDGSKRRKP